jgi:hypothetical protein
MADLNLCYESEQRIYVALEKSFDISIFCFVLRSTKGS